MQLDHIGIHIPVLSCFCIYTRAARPKKAKGALHGAALNYSSRPATAAPSLSSASRRTARGHAAFIR